MAHANNTTVIGSFSQHYTNKKGLFYVFFASSHYWKIKNISLQNDHIIIMQKKNGIRINSQ